MTPGAGREAARGECPTDPASTAVSDPPGAAGPPLPTGAPLAGRPPLWRLDRRPLDYRAAWALQRDLLRRRQAGEIPDLLLLTEHPPVFTLGRTSRREHLLFDAAPIVGGTAIGPGRGTGRGMGGGTGGAEVVETDRGGDVTFHGPGQLVAYPIVALSSWKKDVRAWLRLLEAAVIRAAADFGVPAGRRPGVTGVFCPPAGADPASGRGRPPPRKLAAIGVRVSRWVTSHGVAVNANTDLRWFDRIVPCGLRDAETTSLAAELGRPVAMPRLADALAAALAAALGRELQPAPEEWSDLQPAEGGARRGADASPAAPPPVPGPGPAPGQRPPPGRRPPARRPRNAPAAV